MSAMYPEQPRGLEVTSDSNPALVGDYVLGPGKMVTLKTQVVCTRDGVTAGQWHLLAGFRRETVNDPAVQVGNTRVIMEDKTDNLLNADYAVGAGGKVHVQVTGLAATTLTWRVESNTTRT